MSSQIRLGEAAEKLLAAGQGNIGPLGTPGIAGGVPNRKGTVLRIPQLGNSRYVGRRSSGAEKDSRREKPCRSSADFRSAAIARIPHLYARLCYQKAGVCHRRLGERMLRCSLLRRDCVCNSGVWVPLFAPNHPGQACQTGDCFRGSGCVAGSLVSYRVAGSQKHLFSFGARHSIQRRCPDVRDSWQPLGLGKDKGMEVLSKVQGGFPFVPSSRFLRLSDMEPAVSDRHGNNIAKLRENKTHFCPNTHSGRKYAFFRQRSCPTEQDGWLV